MPRSAEREARPLVPAKGEPWMREALLRLGDRFSVINVGGVARLTVCARLCHHHPGVSVRGADHQDVAHNLLCERRIIAGRHGSCLPRVT